MSINLTADGPCAFVKFCDTGHKKRVLLSEISNFDAKTFSRNKKYFIEREGATAQCVVSFFANAPVVDPSIGCWIPATCDAIPPGAFCGGTNVQWFDSKVFVIRAHKNGGCLPGKFVTGHHDAYVPLAGEEHHCPEFEVLCNSRMRWQHCRGSGIPPNAFVAGSTENGEPLYVGKTVHNEEVCIGKVQRSHGALYFPWGGKELTTPTFEILVK